MNGIWEQGSKNESREISWQAKVRVEARDNDGLDYDDMVKMERN